MSGISEQIRLTEPRLACEESAATREKRFTELVRRQARFVFRVAYSVLRNVQDADDAAQETFLKLYRSRGWERIEDEKAFLARAAWRTAVDQLGKAAKSAPVSDSPWTGQDPEQAAVAADWDAVIHRLIDALPEELRQPLTLSSFEGLNSRESAKVMGISENAIRTRVMRARRILREKLNALGAGHHEER